MSQGLGTRLRLIGRPVDKVAEARKRYGKPPAPDTHGSESPRIPLQLTGRKA